MQEPTLLELQRLFKSDVVHQLDRIAKHLKPSDDYSLSRRMHIYQNNSQLTVDSVAEDFSTLGEHIGEEKLRSLVERFLRDKPSHSHTRFFVSRGFPDYLDEQNEALLSDIARYDWAQTLSSFEPELKTDFRPIRELDSDDVELVVDPTLQLLQTRFAVHTDYRAGETFLAIRYRSPELEIEELTKPQFVLLQSIVQKTELPELSLREEEISQAFADWVKDGTIIGFRTKELQP